MDQALEQQLLSAARSGDEQALSDLFRAHQSALERMVELRLEAPLRRRVDPVDVVQDAWLDVTKRFGQWSESGSVPFRVWLRLTTLQSLARVHRHHYVSAKRDLGREAPRPDARPSVSAVGLADVLVGRASTPSHAAHRQELRARVLAAIEELDELDREVIILRQFEDLPNAEIAAELGIEPAAASKRFARALLRLKPALAEFADPTEWSSA
jgi:RNA polymerase sigma-70 factor (ECF subfamily)